MTYDIPSIGRYIINMIYDMCIYESLHLFLVPRGQKRVLDSLELELKMVMSYHEDAGNWMWILCKSSLGSYPLSHLYTLTTKYLKACLALH